MSEQEYDAEQRETLEVLARAGVIDDPSLGLPTVNEERPAGLLVRFDTDERFWRDWSREWLRHGTVYAVNHPEPRVVPLEALTIHEGPCPNREREALDAGRLAAFEEVSDRMLALADRFDEYARRGAENDLGVAGALVVKTWREAAKELRAALTSPPRPTPP